ncbi:nitrate- and nitrite sensing domain-containing protein [Streptomyces hirsutus]|uniref:sensor histidine kinase n=1 Tax=Streptomyces TaxID=1883 RepID=UPI0038656916|nr:nitrate- and nitrite sensing domain-containing protein [Streptomyces hirsutus]WTD77675.1 nitrate- and nitrite sensing domain-containing protein [Streptomyces sp. NBC_01635]
MRRSTNSPEPSARGNFTPPPRAAAPSPVHDTEPTAAPAPSGGRFSPRNWRVATRLNAILLIPVLVGLVMGGFQVKGSIDTWQEAEDAENTARLVRASLSYANALYLERDLTAAPLLQGKGADDPTVVKARAETDKAADEFDAAAQSMPAKGGLERRLELLREAEPKLTPLRQAAYTSKLKGVETEEGYVQIANPLMQFANELGLGTGNVTSYGRTVYAISLSKAALSLQRSIGTHLLVKPGPTDSQLASQRVALSSYAYLENIAVQEYLGGGTAADTAKLKQLEQEIKADGADLAKEKAASDPDYVPPPENPVTLISEVARLGTTDPAARTEMAGRGITVENYWAVNTLKYDGYSEIESDLADAAVDEASAIAGDAQRDAFVTGSAVVIALLAAFILAGMVARQMSRSMRKLRHAAFGIAEQRLPMLVDQLSRTDPGRVDTRVTPIPITSTDEIGEVARAFDQVHREAVRLASEQALLRGNINAIFTNLSRRNQSLIEGQLTLLTGLENNEADPDQLEHLFKLDHLATRMRRNGENLLVLAGEEPGRRWDQPVPLVDVIRAASSEVEQYERIELSGVPEAEIHGRAVTDLVHLLAELLENATTFSSPQTKVRVTATRLPDGRLMIEIHDKGIGLTAEDFADINHKLANPPTVDVAISQRMGLFVVGRLSDRHGIRVQLRPSGEQAGTTSLVMLPDAITHGGGGETQPDRDEFTVSQIIPEQNTYPGEDFSQQQPPLRTAAELGFDDSRYEVPDDLRDLDPVGRSLMRGERRAALDPQGRQPALPDPQASGDRNGSGQAAYPDEFAAAPQGYGDGQGAGDTRNFEGAPAGYPEQEPAGFDQQAYGNGQQPPYEGQQQSAYDDSYYAPGAQLPQNDSFSSNGGYPDGSYAEPAQDDRTTGGPAGPGAFPAFGEQRPQDDWPQQDGYQNGYPAQYPAASPEAESAPAADAAAQDSVGFNRPGPAHSASHELTDAGLPRRGASTGGAGEKRRANQEPTAPAPAAASVPARQGDGDDSWRSANDERWQQASSLRRPKAGGVTSSGLPRRVPKANLVEGAAETTPQGGPQVSRAPEDIRGRLSNLRRGVQQGRNAGSETNGQATGNHRSGPDSTYNQER